MHEAYLKLLKTDDESWNSRGHFFGAAAEAMRRILVDQARRKKAVKHAGGLNRQPIDDVEIVAREQDVDILAIHELLGRFEKMDPQAACLVKLRYFSGFTIPEAAKALGIAKTTADRHWAYARAWLHSELKSTGS